ncbi:MAG: hypothetical protein ABSB32_15365 [Thermodesulfobacteriota bacterium]
MIVWFQIVQVFFYVSEIKFYPAAYLLGWYGKCPLAKAVSDRLRADSEVLAQFFYA